MYVKQQQFNVDGPVDVLMEIMSIKTKNRAVKLMQQ